MIEYLHKTFQHLIQENPQGVFFFVLSNIIVTIILLRNDKRFREGLAGDNGWQPAEIVIYLWIHMMAPCIFGVLFLKLQPPDFFWFFMLGCLLFALAGREGIQMLFNWRGSKPSSNEEKTN